MTHTVSDATPTLEQDEELANNTPTLFVTCATPNKWRPLTASDCADVHSATSLAAQLHDALLHLHQTAKRAHGRISLAACVVSVADHTQLRLCLRDVPEDDSLIFTAPELLSNDDPASAHGDAAMQADVYAFGIVCYWLATHGRLPFAAAAKKSRRALLHAITKQTAAKAMPLADDLLLFAEIRAATRHKASKRSLLRPAVVAAAPAVQGSSFKQRAANRQSRAVVNAGPQKLTLREQREQHASAPITLADAGERDAFGAIFGADALLMLDRVVAERATEGLFRVPGDTDAIDAYRKLDGAAARAASLAAQRNVHTIASLLKRAFHQHSPALVPDVADREARELLKLAENAGAPSVETDDMVVEQLRAQLATHCNDSQRLALRHLARAMHALVAAEADNKMSLVALLTCIGPSLHCSPGWIKWSVMRFDKIFS